MKYLGLQMLVGQQVARVLQLEDFKQQSLCEENQFCHELDN